MRVRVRLAAIFFLGTVCGVASATAYSQMAALNQNTHSINVRAWYSAKAIADTATVHIGFIAYAPDAQAAYAKGSETSNAIVKALAAAGVANNAIQSDSQQIEETPRFSVPVTDQALKKFQVRQSWAVKTRAADAGKILDVAVHAGANQSGQIDWSVTDEDALQAKAAKRAIVRARMIALQMAQGLGVQLGALIDASATQFTKQAPVMAAVPRIGGIVEGSGQSAGPTSVPLSIHPHQVEITSQVYAVFAFHEEVHTSRKGAE